MRVTSNHRRFRTGQSRRGAVRLQRRRRYRPESAGRQTNRARSGLAPLEFVLALPLMMMVMALMIIIGTVGAWKIRTSTNARHAVWRTRQLRTGQIDPHPPGWPTSAVMRVSASSPSPIFAEDPFAEHVVVRGPVISDPMTGKTLQVDDRVFDMQDGVREGAASIKRDFPLLKNMPPKHANLQVTHELLDEPLWQFWTTGTYCNQLVRRVPRMYKFDLSAQRPSETQRYTQAAIVMSRNVNGPALMPLDRDEELFGWYYRYVNFYPGVNARGYCTYDRAELWENVAQPHIIRIQGTPRPRRQLFQAGVPGRMTRTFLRMYRGIISQVDQALQDPELTAADRAILNQRRADAVEKESQLANFQQYLLQ